MGAVESCSVFTRDSFLERGAIPNTWSLTRVQKTVVASAGLTLLVKTLFRPVNEYFIPWHELRLVEVVEKQSWKSAGGSAGAAYMRRICTLDSSSGKFEIDISEAYPDFRNTRQFLNALKEFVEVVEPKKNNKPRQRKSKT